MPSTVLIVTSLPADRYASLQPMARALAGTFDRVDVMVLMDGTARASSRLCNADDRLSDSWLRADRLHYRRSGTGRLPSATGGKLGARLTAPAVDLWAARVCPDLDDRAGEAELIVVQSGATAALIRRLRRRAPLAEIVYLASEPLCPPRVHPRIAAMLDRDAHLVDRAVTMRPDLLPELHRFSGRVALLPQALDPLPEEAVGPRPFDDGMHIAVLPSTGTGASFVQIAAAALPDARFHLLADTGEHRFPGNVARHPGLSRAQALPFLLHADLAAVADGEAGGLGTFGDTEPDLAQLGHRGIPVVCPAVMAGAHPLRFGYDAGRSASVRAAFARALRCNSRQLRIEAPTWAAVAALVAGRKAETFRQTAPSLHREVANVG